MSEENAASEGGDDTAVSAQDELGALYDSLQEPETTGNQEAVTSAEKSQSDERVRDDKGRFTKSESATDDEGATAQDTGQGDAQEGETALPSIDPPASWSADWKAKWGSFDRATQDYILGREKEAHEAIEQRANKLKEYEPLNAVIEPLRQRLQLQGQQPAQYFGQLAAADQMLRQDAQAGIREIARLYGIDLSQLNQQAESGIDPALAPVMNEVNQVKSQFQQFMESQRQAETARLQAELDAFAKDKPHFEDVRKSMAALMNSGEAADLQSAYEMAIWANPSTRSKLQAEQAVAAEAKRKKESEERAKNAARISKTNLSSKGAASGATPEKFDNREDELGSIWDRVQGAA